MTGFFRPSSRPARALAAAACLLGLAGLAGCGGSQPSGSSSPTAATSSAGLSGDATVFAAASLTGTFTELGKEFEAAYPGTKVTFNFGSSATLATQINQGAPAGVFAAASDATMKTVTDAGNNAGEPVSFATNTLEIAVPKGNPGHITGLKDFADESKTIALCAQQVPCGAAATKVFALAGITPKPDTLESDVKATLQKVQLGEVDAALVYKTDVIAAGDQVEGIEFPEAAKVVNNYPITTLKAATSPEVAQAFVDYVVSPQGEQVLGKAGFGQP
ncbi:molybdate ABC transporter substrate-binding protein [Microlunatus ginsengisoli]|uniref:Molybdate ABC transporter substrate-binding protein n=1 Tax=Microlunatus ginsengisoli TaxID=363863 RepID=A0ABP6ZW30_9ACTN